MPKIPTSLPQPPFDALKILQSGMLLLALIAGSGASPLDAQTPALAPSIDTPLTGYYPLTGAERWHRYLHQGFLSPKPYLGSLAAAGGEQLGNNPPEWRQGTAGYARRAASLFGMVTIETTIHEAGAAALGYDSRYARCNCDGFFRRSGHAILWSFITRNNHGSARPDLPALSAAYGSGMLSMYWYPARFSPLTDGVRAGTQQVGSEVGVNLVREFAPDIRRLFRIKR